MEAYAIIDSANNLVRLIENVYIAILCANIIKNIVQDIDLT